MKYIKFEIQNFKGIRHAVVDLGQRSNARIFTFVGLNEGGKTTALEAIHSFNPDIDAGTVTDTDDQTYELLRAAVPRSKISDFTGRVSVKATIAMTEDDVEKFKTQLRERSIVADLPSDARTITFERYVTFESGDSISNWYSCNLTPNVKFGKQRTFKKADNKSKQAIRDVLVGMMPTIAYFPTFVFEFPDRIYLSDRNAGPKNEFYRRLFQDILDFGGRDHTIDQHIVKRLRKDEYVGPWAGVFSLFNSGDESAKIDQVIDHAAKTVTQIVYRKWDEIFGETIGDKEILITWKLEEGLTKKLDTGQEVPADEHDIYVQFRVKDGADRFPIGTRSLGFRWFFSFLLFTQFRVGRNTGEPVVFLLDEPASNLHASAQQKLIESFPEIAREPHCMIYSTHSHYMIEPSWLEQAYVVQNEPATITKDIIDEAILNDDSVDIKVTPYRQFAVSQDNAVSYFQPIADRLKVVPSKFDIDRAGIIVEGKSDYYVLEYFNKTYFEGKLRFYPALGAGTLSALIGLMKGWGTPLRIILDSDDAGLKELSRYKSDYVLNDSNIKLIGDFFPGVSKIEKVLSRDDTAKICKQTGRSKISKKDFLLVFQEYLSNSQKLALTTATVSKMKRGLSDIETFLEDKA